MRRISEETFTASGKSPLTRVERRQKQVAEAVALQGRGRFESGTGKGARAGPRLPKARPCSCGCPPGGRTSNSPAQTAGAAAVIR